MNEILINRLQLLMEENNLSQREFERRCKLSNGSITKWKTSVPNQRSLQKVSDAFNVTVGWLLGESDYQDQMTLSDYPDFYNEYTSLEMSSKFVKVLGTVAAGKPIEMNEDILGYEDLTQKYSHPEEYFGLKIKGDSMTPRMCNGDIVIVKHQNHAESGDIVIASVNGDEANCKKLIKHESGIMLVSFNPNYEPMYFSNEEIQSKPVIIMGKVVELRCKF